MGAVSPSRTYKYLIWAEHPKGETMKVPVLALSLCAAVLISCQGGSEKKIQVLEQRIAELEQRLVSLKGERGELGPPGPQGPTGPQGLRGLRGIPGEDLSSDVSRLTSDVRDIEPDVSTRASATDVSRLEYALYGLAGARISARDDIGFLKSDVARICSQLRLICYTLY